MTKEGYKEMLEKWEKVTYDYLGNHEYVGKRRNEFNTKIWNGCHLCKIYKSCRGCLAFKDRICYCYFNLRIPDYITDNLANSYIGDNDEHEYERYRQEIVEWIKEHKEEIEKLEVE